MASKPNMAFGIARRTKSTGAYLQELFGFKDNVFRSHAGGCPVLYSFDEVKYLEHNPDGSPFQDRTMVGRDGYLLKEGVRERHRVIIGTPSSQSGPYSRYRLVE
ncbi:unnamed protein product [Cyclocybe aegerita]|uniref:Uncharacterized protein n=1 Tax=Cyclocybe aegerita TaxID=1973307 RepID=A0A8S0VRC3_CYCAE|nr:unnamed protein product [Cyclocybe aegerita]